MTCASVSGCGGDGPLEGICDRDFGDRIKPGGTAAKSRPVIGRLFCLKKFKEW